MSVVGVDVQTTRTALVVAGGPSDAPSWVAVGDGRRRSIPNCVAEDGRWGSEAAEAYFRAVGGTATGTSMCDWGRNPRAALFWQGAHDRLWTFLGGVDPSRENGFQLCLSVARGQRGLVDGAHGLLRYAGVVAPTNALLCRSLLDRRPLDGGEGPLVAIACGENWTAVQHYELHARSGTITISPGARAEIDEGSMLWTTEFAARVLAQTKEGPGPEGMLAVLDGVVEFGGALRERHRDEEAEWDGALSDQMFSPLMVSVGACVSSTGVSSYVEALRSVVADVAGPGGRTPRFVIGGLGAAWPVVDTALPARASIWRSSEPELDLAVGAATWPGLKRRFEGSVPAILVESGPAPRSQPDLDDRAASDPAPVYERCDEELLPPSERDNW